MSTKPTKPVSGPFPIPVTATSTGAELDVSSFLVRAVFTELVQAAVEDPEGLADELADLGGLLSSAAHQGADSHARHEFDERMNKLVDEFADGGTIPLYGRAVAELRDRLAEIAAPRPLPKQRGERGAA